MAQVSAVRWPDGLACPQCESRDVMSIATRSVFKCRACLKQFSVTAGTALHGTRHELAVWFRATEDVIRQGARWSGGLHLTVRALALQHDLSHRGALRMRKIIFDDLAVNGAGLLRKCVCTEILALPPHIAPGSEDHWQFLREIIAQ